MSTYIFSPDIVAKRLHFRGRRCAPCFWCHCLLGRYEATMDHVVSVRRGGPADDPENMVICCRRCNDERNIFQVLAAAISYLEYRLVVCMGARSARFVGGWQEWVERREDCLGLMLHWERLYHARLEGEQLEACLAEIDEVLEV